MWAYLMRAGVCVLYPCEETEPTYGASGWNVNANTFCIILA